MPTILAESVVVGGRADGENLWLAADDAVTVTGWTFKPEAPELRLSRGRRRDLGIRGTRHLARGGRAVDRAALS